MTTCKNLSSDDFWNVTCCYPDLIPFLPHVSCLDVSHFSWEGTKYIMHSLMVAWPLVNLMKMKRSILGQTKHMPQGNLFICHKVVEFFLQIPEKYRGSMGKKIDCTRVHVTFGLQEILNFWLGGNLLISLSLCTHMIWKVLNINCSVGPLVVDLMPNTHPGSS